jgi:uncharacterized membrane protein YebE (DUF533 family)
MRRLAPTNGNQGGSPGLGSRLGHQPELHRLLAMKVLQAHLQIRNQLQPAVPSNLRGVAADEAALLVRAMIAAAHADGEVDQIERRRILRALNSADLAADERRRLQDATEQPQCLEALAREVHDPKQAARFYAASLAVLDKAPAVSRAYLAYVARRLGLPADQEVRLNRRLGMPR